MKYDYCLWWTLGNPCNLDCGYCCATRNNPRNEPVDDKALLRTLDATGRTFRLHFTSIGEPFVTPGFVNTLRAVTQKHYVSFNTNLVAKAVRQLAHSIIPERVVEITASLHIEELEKKGFTDRYVRNYRELLNSGFPIVAQVVAHPALIPRLEYYRDFFRSRGVEFRCNHFIGEFAGRDYPGAYTDRELEIFGRNIEVGPRWRFQAGMPCNAGYNIAVVRPDGTVVRCYDVDQEMGHVYRGIEFGTSVTACPSATCSCALNFLDDSLRKAAGGVGRSGGSAVS